MINNYIKADIWRVSRRIPRIIFILIANIIFALVIVKASNGDSWNSVFFMEKMLGGFSVIATICSIVEFVSVFSTDFAAKTMQIAIGGGMKRRHVILTKWLDCLFLAMSDFLFACIVGLIMGGITGVHINAEQGLDILINFLGESLKAGGYYSLAMIAVFYMQSVMIPLLVYICLSIDIFYYILKYLFSLGPIRQWNLQKYLFTEASELFESRLVVGTFDFKAFLLVIIYMAIGYIVSSLLFKKKELEF